ncbi:hypothetical protein SETIT_9G039900v2 [Setaria italica]|uniref:Uncharacterized protein n=1 Tax=Setaria italica TaxID=4555 RepID=A0A368SCV8_SETIT|nr:uncharacterized protein LOC101782935 [Setaria italica]RCV40277.1 hypothetical protein SETIT_9G039900v2 [Setaria italica]
MPSNFTSSPRESSPRGAAHAHPRQEKNHVVRQKLHLRARGSKPCQTAWVTSPRELGPRLALPSVAPLPNKTAPLPRGAAAASATRSSLVESVQVPGRLLLLSPTKRRRDEDEDTGDDHILEPANISFTRAFCSNYSRWLQASRI